MLTRESLKPLAAAVAIIFTLFQIWFTAFGVLEGTTMRADFLGFVMVLIFLLHPPFKMKEGRKEPAALIVLDLCLSVLAVVIAAYITINSAEIMERMRYVDDVSATGRLLAAAALLLTLEITRRTTGWPLVIIALIFLGYAFWGDMLPSALKRMPITTDMILECMYLSNEGLYGIPTSVATGTIFGFIMFGAFLERSHMTNIFMDIACLLTKNSQGGPAKVAIFASGMFGTFSGSAVANVYGTGIFTIPLMKKVGYRPEFAGAVEAVASTGGQLMPPIMGAAAFIMADLAGVPYLSVAKAALLPAVLYYLSLWCMIHFEAVKTNLGYIDAELVPTRRHVIRRLYYLGPVIILIGAMCMGRSVSFCANIATLSIPFIALFSAETRFTFRSFCEALILSAKNVTMIGACCACAGIIIGVISLTGVGYKLMAVITSLAGDNLFLLCVCLMITSMILGMGVPTAPAYIIVATLGAPALIKAGCLPIVAHLFCFYYAILSVITPPVCQAAFAGAAIAEGNAMKTGFTAAKLAVVAFAVPFMFIYAPALAAQGTYAEIGMAVITSLAGVVALSGGMQGHFLRKAGMMERILLIGGGLCMIMPGNLTDVIGLTACGSVLAVQYIGKKREPTLNG